MALPTNRIKKIKLPGDVNGDKTYEIIPEKISDGSGNYAVLPNLNSDGTLAVKNIDNIFSVGQTISDIDSCPLSLDHDSSNGDAFITISDLGNHDYSYLYLTGNTSGHDYYFPDKDGTLATTSDITNVEIVDLTSVN